MSNSDQTIIITGASGLVGSALVNALENDGHKVIRAVRREVKDSARELHWDPNKGEIDAVRFEDADAVIHLAGEGIADSRWSDAVKQRILHSRTKGTLLIAETIANCQNKPHTLACASAIGYYGDRGDSVLTEQSDPGEGFLPDVCQQWEASCEPARDAGIRVANMRIGVVLSPKGGALAKMLTPFKMGVGGVLGNGQQYFSWIALDDLVAGIVHVINTPTLSGPVNMTAPNPVTNHKYTKTLGSVLGRPTFLPMPAFVARLAFGEMADALLLASTRVKPTVLSDTGYHFEYPELEPALEHLLNETKTS
ncbi:TIGR01777 family oxidoreductase [Adhaeretor mobilis]|uniref:Epimerase family protein n=1 Tax=Adhaeretor mobilis TaxID=1930276 RepID=A0A517N2M4_9BACT|nr:TIGR01777 family oxidoreductase [Adhaeretor mobilis]QDT01387.1 Epimerase family protein [Adhaeretor mobilis]